jgi:hypothetical protein
MAWIRIEGEPRSREKWYLLDPSNWIVFVGIAVLVAGMLAVVATGLLVDHLPIPDDDATALGVLGFVFVALFDLLLISGVAASKLRQGQRRAALKSSVTLFLLGLLAALVVGSLPILWQRLMTAVPGLQEFPWGSLLFLYMAADYLWRRRKAAQDSGSYSRRLVIAQGSLSTVVVASSLYLAAAKLSRGEAWFGALHIAVALLYGVIAAQIFVELWKKRPAKPPESMAPNP